LAQFGRGAVPEGAPCSRPLLASPPCLPPPQDFGARDPTAGELASGFSEKVLGNYDTDHVIR
jgi:hypothetical protein